MEKYGLHTRMNCNKSRLKFAKLNFPRNATGKIEEGHRGHKNQ